MVFCTSLGTPLDRDMVSVGSIWIVRHPFHMGLIDDRDPIPYDGIAAFMLTLALGLA